MTDTTKLLLALLLGAAAAMFNFIANRPHSGAAELTVATQRVAEGTEISSDALGTLVVPSEAEGDWVKAAVQADERPLLVGRRANRELHKGDVVLRRDFESPQVTMALKPGEVALQVLLDNVEFNRETLTVGSDIGFVVPSVNQGSRSSKYQILGPYRLLGVGSRVTQIAKEDDHRGSTSGAATISVAVELAESRRTAPTHELNERGNLLIAAKHARNIQAICVWPSEDSQNLKH